MRTKLLIRHIKDCYAVQAAKHGIWPTPFGLIDACGEYRNLAGAKTKHAHHRWLIAICNDPDCPAKLLVLEDDVLALAATQDKEPEGG